MLIGFREFQYTLNKSFRMWFFKSYRNDVNVLYAVQRKCESTREIHHPWKPISRYIRFFLKNLGLITPIHSVEPETKTRASSYTVRPYDLIVTLQRSNLIKTSFIRVSFVRSLRDQIWTSLPVQRWHGWWFRKIFITTLKHFSQALWNSFMANRLIALT